MEKRLLKNIILLIAISFCLFGCSLKEKGIIGTWEYQFIPTALSNIKSTDTFTFNSDGTCVEYLKGYYIDTNKEEHNETHYYNWTVNNNKLVLIPTDEDNSDEEPEEYELVIGENAIYLDGDKYIKQ